MPRRRPPPIVPARLHDIPEENPHRSLAHMPRSFHRKYNRLHGYLLEHINTHVHNERALDLIWAAHCKLCIWLRANTPTYFTVDAAGLVWLTTRQLNVLWRFGLEERTIIETAMNNTAEALYKMQREAWGSLPPRMPPRLRVRVDAGEGIREGMSAVIARMGTMRVGEAGVTDLRQIQTM